MKKLLAVLLCLALLPLSAMAAGKNEPAVFVVTAVDAYGQETNLGSAVLLLGPDVMLSTAPLPTNLDTVRVCGPDGSSHELLFAMAGDAGMQMLVLNGESSLPYASLSRQEGANGTLVGVTEKGQRYSAPVTSAVKTRYEGHDAWLISAKEPLLPGAMILDDAGDLLGVTVAVWGEGEARYVALTGSALIGVLTGSAEAQADGSVWLTDAAMTYDAGALTIDWSECEIDGFSEESTFTLYFEDVMNTYTSYLTTSAGATSVSIVVVPGREYRVWLRHDQSADSREVSKPEDRAMSFAVPEIGTLTDYGFTSECYLAWALVGGAPEATEELPKLEFISADSLRNPDIGLYMQVINTYEVEEEIERDMIYVLHTPEDYTFFTGAGYIFMPEYQEHDAWNADITGMFEDYLVFNGTGNFAPGEYTVSYVIGGEYAGGFSFWLK